MNIKRFFNKNEKQQIEQAICDAEKKTSGEIRVHIDRNCEKPLQQRAVEVFYQLGMDKTELQNGVLFYLSIEDKMFAVIGDKGIDQKVPPHFWDETYGLIREYFSQGRYAEGLCKAISQAGEQLSTHFPIAVDDRNELPNEISFDDYEK